MKLIKTIFLILTLTISSFSIAGEDRIENYFRNIFETEKYIFHKCVSGEKLNQFDRLNTKCMVSERIKRAAYVLENKENLAKADILDGFNRHLRLTNNKLLYPPRMQRNGEMGYVILNFDIDEDGNTTNIGVEESMCGNMHSPFANFESCRGFNITAINYIKNTKYKPSSFNETLIYTKDAKYRLSFILEGAMLQFDNSKSIKEYEKALRLIKKKKFEEAYKVALENKDTENEFIYELARIKYIEKDYISAINYMDEFLNKIEIEKDEIPESMLAGAASIMIESLYNKGDYQKVIELSEKLDSYLMSKKPFEEVLAIAYLYIGASYINLSMAESGLFYLVRSKRMSSNQGQIEYINRFINNVSNYL